MIMVLIRQIMVMLKVSMEMHSKVIMYLEAIGAKIRFNDDQATDDDEKIGGQSYRLYFDDYNTESELLKE